MDFRNSSPNKKNPILRKFKHRGSLRMWALRIANLYRFFEFLIVVIALLFQRGESSSFSLSTLCSFLLPCLIESKSESPYCNESVESSFEFESLGLSGSCPPFIGITLTNIELVGVSGQYFAQPVSAKHFVSRLCNALLDVLLHRLFPSFFKKREGDVRLVVKIAS